MKHSFKRALQYISIACGSLTAQNCLAFEEDVFLIGSSTVVRKVPTDSAAIAGQLPIGTKGRFRGTPAQVAAGPNKECAGADSKTNPKWSCVCFDSLPIPETQTAWCGWVSKELLSSKEPKLADLISEFNKTSPANFLERKKWSERAIALDPINMQAQKQLLETLEKLSDTAGAEAAKRSFDNYLSPSFSISEPRILFSFSYGLLEPIAEFKHGELFFRDFNNATQLDFRNRGRLYYLYSQGNNAGAVETTARFNCGIQRCPAQVLARALPTNPAFKPSSGLATNFELIQTNASSRPATKEERAMLLRMANAWLDQSKKPAKEKQAFRKFLKEAAGSVAIASWNKDRQPTLIGNWSMGSENDRHYGAEDDYYESLLIIAEQQNDGTYKRASGSGSISQEGCSYFDHIDINGDGTDEIILLCEGLEGSYSYRLMQRSSSGWRIAKD
jgi:hypothetical protein